MFGLHKGTMRFVSELILLGSLVIVFTVILTLAVYLDSVLGGWIALLLYLIICRLTTE